jgi:phasin family protein
MTPVNEPAAKVDAPAAPAAVPVTVAATPAPKAVPAKVEAPVAKTAVAKTAPKPAAKAAAKPAAKTVTAPAAKRVAKKKVAVKAAPKTVAKTVATKAIQTIKPAVAKARAVVTKEVNIMEASIKNAADKAKTMFADANAKSTKAFEDMNEFSKGNIEAIVESGKIAAKGMEAMGQDAAEYSRKQFEGATAALKSLSSVKSPTDFFKLQSDYARSAFDSLVAQTSKNTEAMLKLVGEVAQPISNRVAVAVEKVKIAA